MNILGCKIAAVCLACLIAFGCSSPSVNTNSAPSATSNSANLNTKDNSSPAQSKKDAYPQEVVDEFVRSCQKAGSSAKLCTCLIDKVQEKYSFEDFNVIELKLSSGDPPDEFIEFVGRAKAGCMR